MGYSPINITQALNIYYTFNCPAFISSVKTQTVFAVGLKRWKR